MEGNLNAMKKEKGERKQGVKGQSVEGNLNAMKKEKVHRKAVD